MPVIADFYAKLGIRPDARSFATADRLLKGVKQTLIAIGAYQGVKFLAGLVEETVEAGGHLFELAQQVGIAVEPLQQLAFAGEQSGIALGEMSGILGKLSKNAYDASKGGKEQAQAFKRVGVSVKDAHGKLKPTEELLGDLADKFSEMPDGPKKTALAMGVFGRSGKQMLPLLNEGRKGIEKMRKEFEATGAQISGADAKAMDGFGDDVNTLKLTLKGLQTQVVVGLLPALQENLEKLRAWVDVNREVIKVRLRQFIEGLITAAEKAGQAFEFLVEHSEEVKIVLGVLAGSFVVTKVAAVAAAVASLAAWAPFLAMVTAIALAIHEVKAAMEGTAGFLDSAHEWLADRAIDVSDALGITTGDGANNPVTRLATNRGLGSAGPALPPSLGPATLASSRGVGSGPLTAPVSAPITINAAPGMDGKQLAQQIGEHLEGAIRTAYSAVGQ